MSENILNSKSVKDGNSDKKFWFARVDIMVLRDKTLRPCEKTIFSVICANADVGTRSASLPVKEIAEQVNCGVRTVQKGIQTLLARGVIERLEQFENGQQVACEYRIVGCDAECYKTAQSAEEKTAPVGAENDVFCDENDTPAPAKTAHQLLEPESLRKEKRIKSIRKSPLTPQSGIVECHEEANPECTRNNTPGTVTTNRQEAVNVAYQRIVEAYNRTLPELPSSGRLTEPRKRAIDARIREDPDRSDLDWWERYFLGVRDFPWLMGNNPHGWRASLDWLIGEEGMQKTVEGCFSRSTCTNGGSESGWEAQRRYTNAEGQVDARALLLGE